MIINGEWKNKIRTMRANGDNKGAKRELRKAKMSGYEKTTLKNKVFIDYCLAHYSYVENNYDLTNRYLSYIEDIFSDERNREEMNLEYCNYLWLNVNNNYEKMNIDEIIKNMTLVYNYYSSINKNDIALTAMENIFRFEGKHDRILESLEKLIQCKELSDWNFVESILNDCEAISHSLYINALNIVNKYKINIYVV